MKKNAFTLAEVLITLGIIGVVAAITLPALINKHEKKIVETKIAQFYSIMNQSIKLSEVENGNCTYWDYPAYGQDAYEWVDKYLKPYMKIVKVYSQPKYGNGFYKSHHIYVLSNGVIFQARGDIKVHILASIYGKKIKLGVNTFSFMINPTRYKSPFMPDTWLGDADFGDIPPGFKDLSDREGLLATCKVWPARCAGLLMHEGWKFPKDYPYKF